MKNETVNHAAGAAESLVTVERSSLIQPDSEMQYIGEYVPFAEGAPLSDFMEEAEVAARAINETGATLEGAQRRALFLMRGLYFLGVLRGGEAYRSMMLDLVAEPDAPDPAPLPFSLDEGCAETFAWELHHLSQKDLAQLWAKLGF